MNATSQLSLRALFLLSNQTPSLSFARPGKNPLRGLRHGCLAACCPSIHIGNVLVPHAERDTYLSNYPEVHLTVPSLCLLPCHLFILPPVIIY